MKQLKKELDLVIENMRMFMVEMQNSQPPMVFQHTMENDSRHFIHRQWQLPDEYIYFLQHYAVEGVTWSTGDYINLWIYSADDLLRGQDGYQFNSVTNEVIEDWPQHYLVIASDEGDPYCLDLARGDTAIFTAQHGMGSWDFSLAYDNLVMFLESVLIPPNFEEEIAEDFPLHYFALYITGTGNDKVRTLLLLKKRLSCDYVQAKKSLENVPFLIYKGIEATAQQIEQELKAIGADYEKRQISLAEFLQS
ncbi:SMI1/KNR4 family protein [Lysinibacillus sp. NPDC098008]|uniref:SMI1/KNR4 family protein n=1 Tax=Lysinibacillus sp. NPDC098008 TaxID=3364146 RepID=UPI00380CB4C9